MWESDEMAYFVLRYVTLDVNINFVDAADNIVKTFFTLAIFDHGANVDLRVKHWTQERS